MLFTVIDGIAVFECVLSAYRQKISREKKIIFSATCIVAVHRYFCTGNNNPTMNRQIERTMLGCLGAPMTVCGILQCRLWLFVQQKATFHLPKGRKQEAR